MDRHDLVLLIKHVPLPGRDVVRWLAARPGEHFTYLDIARGLQLAHEDGLERLADAVARAVCVIDECCDAFYMTPLIAVEDGTCSMSPEGAPLAIAALTRLESELEP